ncbi:unnamed protein product [Leptidea sinapis]|uniref:Uncharacterized protein n=1 Tax=Leptidea sinapis TaxID=189913 RepID=A0A5E4Q2C3_9NEOP|nr:unnamed protein product [Leptidea sinapis]
MNGPFTRKFYSVSQLSCKRTCLTNKVTCLRHHLCTIRSINTSAFIYFVITIHLSHIDKVTLINDMRRGRVTVQVYGDVIIVKVINMIQFHLVYCVRYR